MKKTLIVCPHYPLPEMTGANMRTMHFVRFFQRFGSVDIAYTYLLRGAKTGAECFRMEYPLLLKKHGSVRRALLYGLATRMPMPVYHYRSDSREGILSRIASENFDYVLVRCLHATSMLFGLAGGLRERVIVDADDIISGSLYDQMINECDGALKRMMLRANRILLRWYERRCLGFGAALVASEGDRIKLATVNGNPPFVVPNVYDLNTFSGCDGEGGFRQNHHFLFVGTLNYAPNVQGLRWFAETIFPEFRRKHADAKLVVVGRQPIDEVRSLCENSAGLELHADPEDLAPFYRDCRAVVVPLLAGGGTRVKILEAALAMRPVLSTPVGAEGLELEDGEELLLFKDAIQFQAAYDKLSSSRKYHSIIANARQVIERKYSRKCFEDAMVSVLAKIDHGQDRKVV